MPTKKDFQATADMVMRLRGWHGDNVGDDAAYLFCKHHIGQNARFDMARFLKACGVHAENVTSLIGRVEA
jgi:hypothetical protein